jgi:beta-N-acetylhexosaminidase
MTLGPVMLDLHGTELLAQERELLAHPAVGGVILFSRNYESPEQLQALTAAVHDARHPRLLLAVDQEGGRVQRFRDGFTHLPPAGDFGKIHDSDPERGRRLAENAGWLMAAEVLAAGVDLSFAPVLDLDYGVSGVIGDRAFHRDPEIVGTLALAYQRGMHQAGMATVGKHFPGHGAVAVDSHLDLPVDDRQFADLEMNDLRPFARLAANGMEAVMAAHILFPAIDSQPAGFSRFWITQLLREQMGFQGAVFSDDLSMGGAQWAGDYAARADMALDAGCDMVLVCNHPEEAVQVVEHLENYRAPASSMRLARLHGRTRMNWPRLQASDLWRSAREALSRPETEPWLDMDLD